VGPERLPQLLMATFADEVEIDLTDTRKESVWIVAWVVSAAVIRYDAVIGNVLSGQLNHPDSTVFVLKWDLYAINDDGHAVSHGS
jgi:hypothetical protein